ncbi:MAG: hypothetical protein R3F47_16890 [Gammaproteobacteria bacterium]|jgi:hypothetical protein
MSEYEENDEINVEESGESDLPPAEEPVQITFEDGRDRTVSSREAERRRLEEDMKRFLSGGGKITQVDPNVRMDPPKKPESNYGSRPI